MIAEEESKREEPFSFDVDDEALEDAVRASEMIRAHLHELSPKHLSAAAVVLAALERLPLQCWGACASFGFRLPPENGCWAWAGIEVNDEGVSFGVGEHFYEPGVGGETESRVYFSAGRYGSHGNIGEWINVAKPIFDEGIPQSEDFTDHEQIEWEV